MSIQSSLMSMLSSVGTALAVPKAIKGLEQEKPSAPVQASGPKMLNTNTVPSQITSYDMATPFERVMMERARKEQQMQFIKKAKEEFKKPQDFSKGFSYKGGINNA